jgi:hypothetical protein
VTGLHEDLIIKFHGNPPCGSHNDICRQAGRWINMMKATNVFYDYKNVPNYGISCREVMDQSHGKPLVQDGVFCTIL